MPPENAFYDLGKIKKFPFSHCAASYLYYHINNFFLTGLKFFLIFAGGGRMMGDAYMQKLTSAMNKLFLTKYSVDPGLVADVYYTNYRRSGELKARLNHSRRKWGTFSDATCLCGFSQQGGDQWHSIKVYLGSSRRREVQIKLSLGQILEVLLYSESTRHNNRVEGSLCSGRTKPNSSGVTRASFHPVSRRPALTTGVRKRLPLSTGVIPRLESHLESQV